MPSSQARHANKSESSWLSTTQDCRYDRRFSMMKGGRHKGGGRGELGENQLGGSEPTQVQECVFLSETKPAPSRDETGTKRVRNRCETGAKPVQDRSETITKLERNRYETRTTRLPRRVGDQHDKRGPEQIERGTKIRLSGNQKGPLDSYLITHPTAPP